MPTNTGKTLTAMLAVIGFALIGILVATTCMLVQETAAAWRGVINVTDDAQRPERTSHAGPTVEQVRALASLVTTRVEVSDVLVTRLDGYTGGIEAAVLLRGDFELGVDLSAAKLEEVNETAHSAVLVLPQPQASQPRVDHERSRIVAVRDKGLWTIVPGHAAQTVVSNVAFQDAQKFVEDSAKDADYLDASRRRAEMVLGSFFRAMAWAVTIRWTKD